MHADIDAIIAELTAQADAFYNDVESYSSDMDNARYADDGEALEHYYRLWRESLHRAELMEYAISVVRKHTN